MKQFVIGYLTAMINSYSETELDLVVEDLKDFLTAIEDYPDPELMDLFGEEELKDIEEHMRRAKQCTR